MDDREAEEMEDEREFDSPFSLRTIWIGVGLVCFLVAVVAFALSIGEFRFWWSGQKVIGRVTSVTGEPLGSGAGYIVWYEFPNAATGRKVTGNHSISAAEKGRFMRGAQVEIDYVGGALFQSRLHGSGSPFWPVIFAISFLAAIGCTAPMVIQAAKSARDDDEEPAEPPSAEE